MAHGVDSSANETAPLAWLDQLGSGGVMLWRRLAEIWSVLVGALAGLLTTRRCAWRYLRQLTLQQIYFTAVQSVVLAGFVGLMLGILTVLPLSAFRVSDIALTARIVNAVLFVLVTPLLIALVVIGRSGTAITAELGELKINQTIETLVCAGIEPHQLLVLPRLIGVTVSLLVLGFWANVTATLGAATYSMLYQAVPIRAFVVAVIQDVRWVEFFAAAVMFLLFGAIIGVVHAHFGFRARSQLDIARLLPRAFVVSSALCVMVAVAVAVLLYG